MKMALQSRLKRVFSRLRASDRTKWFIVLCLIATFVAGFNAALLFRPKSQMQAVTVPPADYQVVLPEGQTTITVTDPRIVPELLARFVVERRGDSITGVPQTQKQIAPRRSLSPADAAFFRHEMGGVISSNDSIWQRANRIRNWLTASRYQAGMPGLETRVPREAYEQMRQGKPVLCGNLAEIYVALCEAEGLTARTVNLSLMMRDGTFGGDTHVGTEVWTPELGGWIYQDPTFNGSWEVEGKPASALQIHNALMDGREIKFASQNPEAAVSVQSYYVDPRLLFRHLFYEYKAGGPLLYFVDARLEPLNLRDRNWIQTDNRADIEHLDTDGAAVVERYGEIAPGLFAQMIGHTLFIRDRREQNRGVRVRSSSGTVEACAYEHWRAEELGLFESKNFVLNGSFNATGKTEGVAADWSVAGPVEALTTLGGQGMAAQVGGKLWQRVEVRPNGCYLMYAKLSVSRGTVLWRVTDASQSVGSKGVSKVAQMTEIVSDVVKSQSGQLDITFEVPDGGAFRVMDVIVIELPMTK